MSRTYAIYFLGEKLTEIVSSDDLELAKKAFLLELEFEVVD